MYLYVQKHHRPATWTGCHGWFGWIFTLLWECYYDYEAEAEREVMGSAYELVSKVPISRCEASSP